jgi:glucosamine-6-phosphate deaminase
LGLGELGRLSQGRAPAQQGDLMQLRIFDRVEDVGAHAAAHAAGALARAIAARGRARLVAATGNSQFGLLDALIATPGVDWERVELFHLDEYLGLPADHPGSFCRFMRDRLIVPTGIVRYHLIDGMGDPPTVIGSLTAALRSAPVDVAITGIGENGHLAFNEPPADFTTTDAFTVVALDETSRRQQVGEAWFARVEDVPTHAITMTVPEILKATEIVCLAHGARKARAVAGCFNSGAPTPSAPASALTTHPRTIVYLDRAAAGLLLPAVSAAYS